MNNLIFIPGRLGFQGNAGGGCKIDCLQRSEVSSVGQCEVDDIGGYDIAGCREPNISPFTLKVSDLHDDFFNGNEEGDWDMNKWEGELLFPWLDENASMQDNSTEVEDMDVEYLESTLDIMGLLYYLRNNDVVEDGEVKCV